MKIIITLIFLFVATFAEPPVDNRYLPPQQGASEGFSSPSQTYGAPGSGSSSRQQTDVIFRSGPATAYGTPSSQRSNLRRPSNQYLVPSNQYNAPSQQYGAPRSSQITGGDLPPALYSAPGLRSDNGFGSGVPGAYEGAQTRQYLPPGRTGYSDDDGNNGEPANYSFEYMVKDDASGNDYGHREARQGDRAEGLYYVLLPDGRKQIVEYEADQNGYQPRISYQDTGLRYNGHGRVSQSFSNGYPTQEGPY